MCKLEEETSKRIILMLSVIIILIILSLFISGYEYSPNKIRNCIKLYEEYITNNCKCKKTGVYPSEIFENYSINT